MGTSRGTKALERVLAAGLETLQSRKYLEERDRRFADRTLRLDCW